MSAGADVPGMTKVTVWNEFVHEQENDAVAEIYPDGIHATVADALDERGFETRTATLQEPEHGLTEAVLEETEMYGERFDIPQPDALVFNSWFEGGEVFRSGCCYRRGKGRVFYFRPGHETYPIYHDEQVQQVLANGVEWAAPAGDTATSSSGNSDPREDIDTSDERTVH